MKKAIVFVIILLIFFVILYYITLNFGNNIVIKDENEIVDYVLNNIKEYEAEIEVTVNSNKTQNIYKMKQYVEGNYSSLEVISSGKINGLKIELKNGNLNIKNTDLKLDKIYENYEPIMKNALFLDTFISDFKLGNSTTYQENEQMIFETENYSNNSYNVYKKLYVDMENMKPVKLEIKDNTKNNTICIIYNNIEIK